jgi:hypothetical protein
VICKRHVCVNGSLSLFDLRKRERSRPEPPERRRRQKKSKTEHQTASKRKGVHEPGETASAHIDMLGFAVIERRCY